MPDRPSSYGHVTQLLDAWSRGDKAALDALMPLVHAELKRVARRQLARERPDHTIQPTALVNEAYLRLVDIRAVAADSNARCSGRTAHTSSRSRWA